MMAFSIGMLGYSGSALMYNRGLPKLSSIVGNTSIYTKEFHVIRHHKGRLLWSTIDYNIK